MQANAASLRIIRSYYAIAGLYTLSAALIWGVNTLFLLDAGLSISEAFVANAAFSVGMVIFEIPTGVVADTLGRRTSFLLSVGVLGATTLGYVGLEAAEAGLLPFVIVSVLMGLGFTFYSGATESWLVDALSTTGYDDELDHVFARAQMVTGAGMLVGTVGGGLLGTIDLAIPFVARALLLGIVFVVAFVLMHDLGFESRPLTLSTAGAEMTSQARDGVAFGWRQPGLRLLMIGGFIENGFFFWAFYAWQPYFLELLERDAIWVAGVVSALISVSMMVGNAIVEWFTRFCGRRTTLLLWSAGLLSGGSIIVGLADSFWVALPALLVATASMGLAMPVRQSYFHHLIPSDKRATVISFDSMVSGVGGATGQFTLGRLAQNQSFSAGYIVGGLVTAAAIPVVFAVRRLGGPADQITGAKAGAEAACAAQGLPAVSAVNAKPPETVSVS
ncbi:MAG: MFS transporter [Hyphomicrobiales bacterium]|nr:MFS transporter [Hyphomicrobiales bacterium]